MRELERESPPTSSPWRLAIIGRGRLGGALAGALEASEPRRFELIGPLGRDFAHNGARPGLHHADAVVLCVPDTEIASAAALIPLGPLVGHCSGATGLGPLAPHEAFSLHPLMTVSSRGAEFNGAGAAVAGSTERALQFALGLAEALAMRPVEIEEQDRSAYHAAASIASNFLITVEAAAERLAASAGVDRELLVPLVRATVTNWAALGPAQALTGPVARGDERTVASQREAIASRASELLPLFDALVDATRSLAAEQEPQTG